MEAEWTEDELRHLNKVLIGNLGICGCGSPWEAWETARWVLNCMPLYESWNREKLRTLLGDGGIKHLVLSMLDNADLIEHGSSIDSSWITPKGEWVRQVLSRGDLERLDLVLDTCGYPEHEMCTDACWVTP